MSNGSRHWLALRLASLPLIPLFFYFIVEMDHLTTGNRYHLLYWLKQPLPAAAVALFIFCSFFHACLGVEEIVEDYVSSETIKKATLYLNKLFFLILGVACFYALFQIHNG